tara:strand:+ start:680 stop:1816 length:1137 start_codon:yes stop_codon:yes gene_type:complete
MSQSTLISAVLGVIIITIFLIDYFKNLKKNPIEKSIKEFVEKKSENKAWYKTNKLFWIFPLLCFLSFLCFFSYEVYESVGLREYLNLDNSKEINYSDFEKLYDSHLKDEIRVRDIFYIVKDYDKIYFIKTDNNTRSDKYQLLLYEHQKKQKSYELLKKSIKEKEEIKYYKFKADGDFVFPLLDIKKKYWNYIDSVFLSMNVECLNIYLNNKSFSYNDYRKCKTKYDYKSMYQLFSLNNNMYIDFQKHRQDVRLYTLLPDQISTFGKSSNYNTFDGAIYESNPFEYFVSEIYNPVFFIALLIFPIILFFRFFFYVGGKNWFFLRKKNISMFIFLLFFISYLIFSLELDIVEENYFLHLILLFPIMTFFAWFFNDKIKAQ